MFATPFVRRYSARALTALGVSALLGVASLTVCAASSPSAEVLRHRLPGSDFPIAAAIEVPPGATTVYLSGQVPPLVNSSKSPTDPLAYGGDTQGQTEGVLRAIDAQLKGLGLGMKDVIKMQVYLVADPAKGNKMDFGGFMAGYTQFFGTAAQPQLPVRSAFQIAALANPAWLVEIEVVAVRSR